MRRLLGTLVLFCFAIETSSFTRSRRWCEHTLTCGRCTHTSTRRLPSQCAWPKLLAKAEHSPAEPDQSAEKWILLVEEEDDLRNAMGHFLANEGGYHVTGVSDARSAMLVCCGIFRPDSSRSCFTFDRTFDLNLEGTNGNNPSTTCRRPWR